MDMSLEDGCDLVAAAEVRPLRGDHATLGVYNRFLSMGSLEVMRVVIC